MLVNYTNLHDRHKVFQVAHVNRDCTQSIWIILQFCFILIDGKKKGKVTNCDNGSLKSLSSQVQVAHENRDCTQSIWIISAVLFYFHRGKRKKGNVTNCGNGS